VSVVTVEAKYIADTSQYIKSLQAATAATNAFAKSLPSLISSQNNMGNSARNMGDSAEKASKGFTVLKNAIGTALGIATFGAFKNMTSTLKNFAKGSFDAAARSEELDIAMVAIGKSTGYGATALGEATSSIRDMGIELGASQQIAIEFAQNNLDLASASKVARVAQDLAVISGQNSTQTTQTLTQAIITGNSMLLKSAGISTMASEGYADYAKEIGKTAGTLSTTEKQQAITNLILKEGGKVAGTYEGAMNSAGKVLRSFARIINDIQIEIGKVLLAGLGPLIKGAYDLLKAFSLSLREGGAFSSVLGNLATSFQYLLAPVVRFLNRMVEMAKSGEGLQPIADKVNDLIVKFNSIVSVVHKVLAAILPLVPAIVAFTVAGYLGYQTYLLYKAIPGYLKKITSAIETARIKQMLFNSAVLANPYILVAAAIIAALALLAAAFKITYDRSKPLRDAVDKLVLTFKNIVLVIMNDILPAFTKTSDTVNNLRNKSIDLSSIFDTIANVLSKFLVPVVEAIITYYKVLANAVRVLIQYWKILYKIIEIIVVLLKKSFIAKWNAVGAALKFVLDKLGPVGALFKKVGKAMADAFSNIGSIVKNAMANVVGFIENAINNVINAVNFLIGIVNKLPGDDIISEVGEFKFSNFDAPSVPSRDNDFLGAEGPKRVTPVDGGGGKDPDPDPPPGGGKDKKDPLAELKKKLDLVLDAFKKASAAFMFFRDIVDGTEVKFGEMSKLEAAFGEDSNIGGIISQYDALSQNLKDLYSPLLDVEMVGKKTAKANRVAMNAIQGELDSLTQHAIDLLNERKRIQEAMTKLSEDYGVITSGINEKFNLLDEAAAKSLKEIGDRFDGIIPVLEKALAAANAAYERENAVLDKLVSEREGFLSSLSDGFRAFANNFKVDEGLSFTQSLQDRVKSVREFTTNIKSLLARGLDPSLVQDFIAAGVDSSGLVVANLAQGSGVDISAINAAQAELAALTSDFQTTASQQYFDIGIAQQEAIVAPLRTAAQQAQNALNISQAARETELAAAQAHSQQLRLDREAELLTAEQNYKTAGDLLVANQKDVNDKLNENAKAVNKLFSDLSDPTTGIPSEMVPLGVEIINGLLAGFAKKYPKLIAEARRMARAVRDEFRDMFKISSPSKVMMTIGEQIAMGLVIGMEQGIKAIEGAAFDMSAAATPELPGVGYPMMGSSALMGGSAATGNSGSSGFSSTYNITVQAGVGDPRKIGQEVVEYIKTFENSNGKVFVSA